MPTHLKLRESFIEYLQGFNGSLRPIEGQLNQLEGIQIGCLPTLLEANQTLGTSTSEQQTTATIEAITSCGVDSAFSVSFAIVDLAGRRYVHSIQSVSDIPQAAALAAELATRCGIPVMESPELKALGQSTMKRPTTNIPQTRRNS